METLQTMNQRASLKSHISSRAIEPKKIRRILEAGQVAPSAGNRQAWYFIVVNDKKTVEKLVDEAFNLAVNAAAREAPVILVALSNPSDGAVIGGQEYYLFDIGLAVENMILAATDLGLVTHLMTNLNEEALKKVLGVPNEVRFVIATPIAYPTTASYEEAARERLGKRKRKDLKEIAYWNQWGGSL